MNDQKEASGHNGFLFSIKLLFFILISVIFISSAGYSLMIKLSLERLSCDSDTIVLGEVIDIECHWSMDRSTIVTIVTLQVQRMIKGGLHGDQILIQYPGGEIGDIGLRVSDMPDFHLRERTLVFLETITDKNDLRNSLRIAMNFWPAFTVFGAAQGKYSIDSKETAKKGGYTLISEELDEDKMLSLETLIARIQKNMRQLAAKKKRIREKK